MFSMSGIPSTGAAVNTLTKDGSTPLDQAHMNGRRNVIRLLRSHGMLTKICAFHLIINPKTHCFQ